MSSTIPCVSKLTPFDMLGSLLLKTVRGESALRGEGKVLSNVRDGVKVPSRDGYSSFVGGCLPQRSVVYTAAVVGVLVGSVAIVRRARPMWYQHVTASVVEYFRRPVELPSESVRTTFMDLPMSLSVVPRNHTHPDAAGDRSAASCFIDRLATQLGRHPYFVQRSRADERNRRPGSRTPYWVKDITAQNVWLNVPEHPLVAFVDVDQYVDMPRFLCDHVHPTIIYTFQPEQVSRTSKDYSYTFDSLGVVDYHVAGGGRFQHQVWNYSMDHLFAVKTFCGIPYGCAAYMVDRRRSSPDHEIIMLTPLGSWVGPACWLALDTLYGRRLERLKLNCSGFNRLVTSSSAGVSVSTGRPGSFLSATIPVEVDDTISAIARTSQYTLTLPQVMGQVDGDKQKAAALLEFHRAKIEAKPDVVCPVSEGVRRYQFDPGNFDPGAKPGMVAFMSPILHGAFVPDRTVGNEEQCVEARVEKVRQPLLTMTPFLSKVMDEFAELLIPVEFMHTLDPTDYDEVLDRQNRPTQRRILANAEAVPPDRKISTFVKREPYQNIKDPRAISQINGSDKRDYSMYVYSFESVLKRQPWYAFGKPPVAVAQRVVDVLSSATTAVNTDFSRFDGHGSNLMRELEKMLLMRAFRHQYHAELLDLHRSQFGLKAYAAMGTEYDTGFTRASGSPETSLFNSIVNAFVAFLARRKTRDTGVFVTPKAAFAKLGIYGGDDGLTADIDEAIYIAAAKMIGQELTVEPIKRGQPGIKFLARIYSPAVWYGELDSCCDLPRQLSKFHVTVNSSNDHDGTVKLVEKARCFLLTDKNTPIIGPFVRAVKIANGGSLDYDPYLSYVSTYLSRFPENEQYPNTNSGAWMDDYAESALPDFDVKKFHRWHETKHITLVDLLSPPLCMEPVAAKSAVPVVIEGDVIPHGASMAAKPPRPKGSRVKGPNRLGPPVTGRGPIRLGPPRSGGERSETFEEMRARKQANGTWVDDPAKARVGRREKVDLIKQATFIEHKYPTSTRPASVSSRSLPVARDRSSDRVNSARQERWAVKRNSTPQGGALRRSGRRESS